MVLTHRRLTAVLNIISQTRKIWQARIRGVYFLAPIAIHQDHMIRAFLPADINIFAQLNIALRAQNCEPTITPIGQGIWLEPIHTNIARAPVTAQINLPKIL